MKFLSISSLRLIALALFLLISFATPSSLRPAQAAPPQVNFDAIGLAKELASIVNNGNGTWDVTYVLRLRNYGVVPLQNVQVIENLAAVFPAPVTFVMLGAPTTSAANLTPNPAYNGSSDANLLIAASSTLPVSNNLYSITIRVRITPNGATGPFQNTAVATATDSNSNTTNDTSNNGTDPNPDNDNSPTNNNSPTILVFAQAPTQVPEGNTLLLVGAGLAGLAGYARLRMRAHRANQRDAQKR